MTRDELCHNCHYLEPTPGYSRCAPCREKARVAEAERQEELRQAGLCRKCGRKRRRSGRAYCRACARYYRERRIS